MNLQPTLFTSKIRGNLRWCHIVYSVQCTAYSVQRTVYSVQCTAYSVQRTVYSVKCTAYSVQRTVHSVQCTAYSVQCTEPPMFPLFFYFAN